MFCKTTSFHGLDKPRLFNWINKLNRLKKQTFVRDYLLNIIDLLLTWLFEIISMVTVIILFFKLNFYFIAVSLNVTYFARRYYHIYIILNHYTCHWFFNTMLFCLFIYI